MVEASVISACRSRIRHVDSPGGQSRWTVQADSPGDSRRDEADYLHVASSGISDASDMYVVGDRPSAGSQSPGVSGAARARARSVT